MFAETNVAKNILEKRYYRGGETSPYELLTRVAEFIASAEDVDEHAWRDKFFNVMNSGEFLPNSPCLVNSGYGGGLFACFVIGVEDNLESISNAKATAMAITKAGGGWGIGLSNLRAEGSPVSGSTHGIAGGPVGFWKTFSYDMQTMTQGGFRDAACMATMDAEHPDIEKFISAKSPVNSVIELLNLRRISDLPEDVAVSLLRKDKAIAAAAETYLSNFNMSVLISDAFMNSTKVSGKSKDILVSLAEGAWQNGEPGVLFIDRIRERTKYDPALIQATNPCGEQPLPPNGSCCLGSINLSEFVEDGKFNIDRFRTTIGIAVRFLDNMITLNEFPTKETEEWSLANRSIGLGIMGYADALIKLGLKYDSEEAKDFAEIVASTMVKSAEYESKKLCEEKGAGTIGDFDGRRNNALLSIAPTGTISLLAGCSAGIEPIFSDILERNDRTGSYIIRHKLHEEDAFVTLSDIHWTAIVDTVATFSRFIDTSISYTVNLQNSASVSEVLDVINYAYDSGCNGCTIYRDGSRSMQVLSSGEYRNSSAVDVLKRPISLSGDTFKFVGSIEGENTNLYVTINSLDGSPWEVFVNTPYIRSLKELQLVTAVTRLSSLALRVGAPIEKIIEQLRKIEGQSMTSIPALIAKALSQYAEADCPECGEKLVYQGGCATCVSCGYSQCG